MPVLLPSTAALLLQGVQLGHRHDFAGALAGLAHGAGRRPGGEERQAVHAPGVPAIAGTTVSAGDLLVVLEGSAPAPSLWKAETTAADDKAEARAAASPK